MKFLIHAQMPNHPFNDLVRAGKADGVIKRVLEEVKPEAVYFAEFGGRRSAILIVDVADTSRIPALAEPFFLNFNAEVHFHPVMTPDDLGKAGLEEIGKKWS